MFILNGISPNDALLVDENMNCPVNSSPEYSVTPSPVIWPLIMLKCESLVDRLATTLEAGSNPKLFLIVIFTITVSPGLMKPSSV